MLRAVLFDLDGTLADTERQCAAAIERALAREGRHLTDAERDFVIGHGWKEIYARLREGGPLPWSFDELIERAGAERERVVAEEGLIVLPGAVELLRAAAETLRVTVVSGSSRAEIAACLRYLEVAHLVPFFVGAEDVPAGKPAPDGYLLGARRLEVEPHEAVVIEDSTAGILAGRAAGMTVVGVRAGNFAGQDQSAAHLVVDTLREIDLALLSSLRESTQIGRKVAKVE